MLLPTLLLSAALAAPTVSTDRECYVAGHDTIAVAGSGFTPSGPVTLTFTGNDQPLTVDAAADASGALQAEVTAPALEDFGVEPPGLPVSLTTADGAQAGFELTDWSATVQGFGRSLRRGQSVKLETIGWIGDTTLYAHYLRGSKVVHSQRIGTTAGACGDLTKRFKAFSFRGAKPGSYSVRISATPGFDPSDRWIGFKRVKLAS
jgi:hypothetical protein